MKRDLPPKKRPPLRQAFACSFSGIATAYLRERSFRIHLSAALIAVFFGFHFSLTRTEWAALILTIAMVLACELLNSALEHLGDHVSDGKELPLIGAAKDIAAGAVLLSSMGAVAVGILLFWRPQTIIDLFWYFLEHPIWLALVLVAAFLITRLPEQIRRTKEEEEERKRNQFPRGY